MAEQAEAQASLTAARRGDLREAANLLLDARRTQKPVAELPQEFRPATQDEAYFVQDVLAEAYGAVGGWKVGAPNADARPMFAPMPAVWIAGNGAEIRALRYRGLEAEIAFLLGKDLPARSETYSREEIAAAIESCHPAIEVLESGFSNPADVDRFSMIADLQMHGAFVFGPACPNWQEIDFTKESVTLSIEGVVRVEKTGSNTAGDLRRLLPWLASEGAWRTGGLRAGQWITTGSWTGNVQAAPRSSVDVQFSTAGRVGLRFAPEQDLEKGLPGTGATRSFT